MKAMVLAAGRGERLRPLTDSVPKPLLEAGAKPLLAWHLEHLASAGVRDVVINVAHLGSQIVERFGDGERHGLRIRWSHEPEPLETAGGLAYARELLGASPFVLVNADIWCDFDLARLTAHRLGERLAHLVLVANPAHNAKGDFSLNGGCVGNDTGARYTYAGIAVISPLLVADIPAGTKAPLAPLLREAAARNAVSGEVHGGEWHDAGTPERLATLRAFLQRRKAAS
ncbi:MAG TPA: nucleotidyltransferase family protein [Burkholderiales bacterium]|nr:nucleotidyltransferase family protein [Burkholderiales bacterium]